MNPPQSPDFNISEAVWEYLDRKRTETSKEELGKACGRNLENYSWRWNVSRIFCCFVCVNCSKRDWLLKWFGLDQRNKERAVCCCYLTRITLYKPFPLHETSIFLSSSCFASVSVQLSADDLVSSCPLWHFLCFPFFPGVSEELSDPVNELSSETNDEE